MRREGRVSRNKKLRMALSFTFLLFILLIFRLGYLQIVRGEELKKSALSDWVRGEKIKPKRGIIYDRNGKKLAVSKVVYSVGIHTREVKEDKREEVAREVSSVLEIDQEELLEMLEENKGFRKIKDNIDKDEIELLEGLEISAIQISDDSTRYYPNGKLAAHLIGFTDADNNGLYGIESTYDSYLSGKEGRQVKIADAVGRQLPFDGERIYDAEDGLSLVLTLDENIQKISEKVVEEAMEEHQAKNITVIAMDPRNGDILSMVNSPNYDLNNPRKPKSEGLEEEWEDLSQEELQQEWFNMWRNYSINDIYEPGSTFKLITAAAAIEENAVNPETPFYCNGYVSGVGSAGLKCSSYLDPHRDLNFQRGLETSCNVVFVDAARMLGKEKFLKYVKAFGFGSKTGIELNGEEYGLIPQDVDSISNVDFATMSYGHSISMTPIQLVNAVSAISNGGNLMKPRLVKEIVDEKGEVVETREPEVIRKVLSKSTSDTMLEMMTTVVSKGGGKNAFIPGYNVGGKTGTAMKIVDGKYVDGKYIGSFIAVAPTEEPKIVVLAIVDDPIGVYYGGTTAAPLTRQIIEESMDYLDIRPEDSEGIGEEDLGFADVPDVVGLTIGEAGETLKNIGLRYMIETSDIDKNSKVLSQSPDPGVTLKVGDVVDIIVEGSQGVLTPNLIGRTEDEIIGLLEGLGIEYDIEGEGICYEQNPDPDVIIESNTVIRIKLKNEDGE